MCRHQCVHRAHQDKASSQVTRKSARPYACTCSGESGNASTQAHPFATMIRTVLVEAANPEIVEAVCRHTHVCVHTGGYEVRPDAAFYVGLPLYAQRHTSQDLRCLRGQHSRLAFRTRCARSGCEFVREATSELAATTPPPVEFTTCALAQRTKPHRKPNRRFWGSARMHVDLFGV